MDIKIGQKIKRLRVESRLTLQELASRSNLTKGFLSQLERDLTSPSIATLTQILEVLDEDLSSFFSKVERNKIIYSKRDRIAISEGEGVPKVEVLVPGAQNRNMDVVLVDLDVGQATSEDKIHEGEEFGFVMAGKIALHLDKRVMKIFSGQCFYFQSEASHYIENVGKKRAKLLWVSSPPTF
ncbi:MAG: cupin domain-containing protein [bacterium]